MTGPARSHDPVFVRFCDPARESAEAGNASRAARRPVDWPSPSGRVEKARKARARSFHPAAMPDRDRGAAGESRARREKTCAGQLDKA